jgi:hypothetical protein
MGFSLSILLLIIIILKNNEKKRFIRLSSATDSARCRYSAKL